MNPAPLARTPFFLSTSKWYLIVSGGLTACTIAVGIVTILGLSPWLFLAIFGATGALLLAPAIGWARAAWSTAAFALFGASWVLVIGPIIEIRLDVALVAVMMTAMAGLFVGCLIRQRRSLRPLPRVPLAEFLAALVPAAGSAIALYGVSLVRGMSLGWAMQGDAQFNTVLARQIGVANGELFNSGQVQSLAQGLMALVHLPGRGGVPANLLLIHDITSQATLWILIILLSSVLAGSIAHLVLREVPRALRLFGIVVAALLPLTWHLTGNAISSGFYNVSIAFFTIELALYFWLAMAAVPLWRSAVLFGISVVMLGAWTPMGIIPLALAAWSAGQGLRRPKSRVALAVWIVAAAQFATFLVLFVLPGFLTKSAVLSAPGAIIPLDRSLFVAMVVAALFIAVALVTPRPGSSQVGQTTRSFALGTALIASSAALGTGFLVFQNRHLADFWTYYPIKFAWISLDTLVLLVFLGSCLIVSTMWAQRILATTAIVASTIILTSMLQLNPAPANALTAIFPVVSLAKNGSPVDSTLPLLSNVSGKKVFFYHYLGAEKDTFMNQWQFQITAKDEFTPIRDFAYRGVTTLADACDAAQAWGGGVRVITSSPWTADRLTESCGSLVSAVVQSP